MSTGWTAPGAAAAGQQPQDETPTVAPAGAIPPGGTGPQGGPRRELVPSMPLFPLRPLGLGEVLGAAVRIYRLRARSVLGVAAVVYGVAFVLITITTGAGMVPLIGDLQAVMQDPTGSSEPAAFGSAADVVATIVSSAITFVLTILAAALVTVALTKVAIGEATGEQVTDADMWALMRRRGLAAVSVTLVISLLSVIAFSVPTALGVLPVVLLQEPTVLTIGAILVGLLLGVLAMLYVWARTVLAVPALVIEELGVLAALRRGFALTAGRRLWRVFGVAVLLYLLYMVAVQVIAGVFGTVATVLYVVILLASGGQAIVLGVAVLTILTMVGSFAASVVLAPFLSAGYVAVYADGRMRHEAWDVELTRRARASWNPDGS